MSHRPKRRAGFGGANQPRMTAEEYDRLIGQHKHIEHKALNSEIAKELNSLTQNRPTRTIVNNDILYPSQPPPLPIEANRTKNLHFKRSTPWPSYSTIQRAAHMYFNSRFPINTITKFLQTMNIPQIQINIAHQVYKLMEQSEKYWRKVYYLGDTYTQRYPDKTRKYALTNAIWALQIGMTLHEFHLDHIVDIIYKKEIWSIDYDIKCQQEDEQRRMNIKPPFEMTQEHKYNNLYDDTTTSYDEEEEYETTDSSERQHIIRQGDDIIGMNKQPFSMIQQNVEQQQEQGLDDLFDMKNIFQNVPTVGRDGKPVVLASNFETDLIEHKLEEKTQFDSGDSNDNDDLKKLFKKYPDMDKMMIRKIYRRESNNINCTVFELDNIDVNIQ
eukprot:538621_1